MHQPLRIFMGYDHREAEAFHVCAQSILQYASQAVSITPVSLYNYRNFFMRPRDPRQSNDFTYARFLTPYLAGYDGLALFMDCDMMLRCDIAQLFTDVDESKAISVVQHEYTPKYETKYLGNKQYTYPRKNWSSVMMFNCAHPSNRTLNPHTVATMSPQELHRFEFLGPYDLGALSPTWNFLVEDYDREAFEAEHGEVKLVHWTNFGPWLEGHEHVDFAEEWFDMRKHTVYSEQEE